MLKVALKLEPNQDAGDTGVAGPVPNRDSGVAGPGPYRDAGVARQALYQEAGVARLVPNQDAEVAGLEPYRDAGVAGPRPYQDAGVLQSPTSGAFLDLWVAEKILARIMNTVQLVNTVRLVCLEIGRLINFEI